MQNNRSFRPATIDDADVLAELVNYAGEGMPLYLWGELAEPGQSAWDVGRHRAAREDRSFSYRNATIIEHDGQCAGCLIGYEIPDNPGPIPDDMPTMFVPLQELENLAPGSWGGAAAFSATRAGHQASCFGRREETATAIRKSGLSVIVSNAQRWSSPAL